jgi:hypothetical protein
VENEQNTFPTSLLDGAQHVPPTRVHKAFLFVIEKEERRTIEMTPFIDGC